MKCPYISPARLAGTLAVLVVAGSLFSCRCLRHGESEVVRDSIVYRTEYVERIDTAWVTIEKEVQRVVVRDTLSRLETGLAVSEAEILPDGLLRHTLEIRPQKISAEVRVVDRVRDSIVYRDREKVVEVPAECRLTWWQGAQIRGFWAMVAAAVLAGLLWYAKKHLRISKK